MKKLFKSKSLSGHFVYWDGDDFIPKGKKTLGARLNDPDPVRVYHFCVSKLHRYSYQSKVLSFAGALKFDLCCLTR